MKSKSSLSLGSLTLLMDESLNFSKLFCFLEFFESFIELLALLAFNFLI